MDTLLKTVDPRTLVIAMGGVLLLIATGLVSYGLWPEFREYRQSQQTLKALEQTVQTSGSLGMEIEKIKNEITLLDRNLHGQLDDLPESKVEAYLMGRLQEISLKNRVRLLGVRPGTGSTKRSLEEIPFNVEVSGDYFDLYAWTRALSDELNFMAISHFNISPLNSTEGSPELKASLTIVSYRGAENG
jgi:Tfp pilus assembly protein PilO